MNTRRISWDRVSFLVPENWEVALYRFLKKGVTRLELEDEYAVRMEAEWIRPGRKITPKQILDRYEKSTRKLTMRASRTKRISGLPPDWHATQYIMRETLPTRSNKKELSAVEHSLVTAFYLCPRSTLVGCFFVHFMPGDRESPVKIMKVLSSDFIKHNEAGLVPWQLYDISFEVPHDFLLENTKFDIGSKLMIFRWKMRRFHLWHFSCADRFLKGDKSMEEWVTGYLNTFRGFPGIVFRPGKNGEILWRRRAPHVIAHRDEISRWCFKLKVHCRVEKQNNQLIVWAFSYRKEEDLQVLKRFLPDA
ncbi:MAG: hypothetical protein R6V03_01140 [Kiritimatiellia bacterium]